MFDCRRALRVTCAVAALICCHREARAQAPLSGEEPPAPAKVLEITPSLLPENDLAPYEQDFSERKSNSYPAGDYAAQLSTAGGENPCCPNQAWGCGGSPYRTGPGNCDNWKVGPVWKVELDGLVMSHEDAPLADLIARSNALQVPPSDAVPDYTEDFGERPGVRIAATSYWPQMAGYEVNVTYTGVPAWDASAVFPQVPPDQPILGETIQRYLTYRTGFHSLELNFIPFNDYQFKPYYGIRYFLVDEDIDDITDEFEPPPIIPETEIVLTDLLEAANVENHLIGFQGGIRRDVWRFRPWLFIEGFANAGIYCNVIQRENIRQTFTTRQVVLADDPITPNENEEGDIITTTNEIRSVIKTDRTLMAAAGEAEIAVVCKLNRCLALRGGYQGLIIDGVELADDAFLNIEPERERRFYHGFFGGVEYRR